MLKKLFYVTFPLSLGLLLPGAIVGQGAIASDIGQGRQVFDHAPLLVRSAASFPDAGVPSAYQFTITVPDNAGAPLQAVKVTQVENVETIQFDVSQTSAFEGNSFAGGPAVSLAHIGGLMPPNGNEVTVVFDPPVAPGKTVTVDLDAPRNPSFGTVYLFGVTAYPVGDNSPGLFLGHARIHLNGDSH